MAASIEREFGHKPELIKGDNGAFEVSVDGERIFSKHELGRFLQDEEILEPLRAR